jgi:preprotein translocase subunit SecA
VEGYNFDSRRYVVEFDDVVNKQREIIYSERDRILEGIDTRNNLTEWIDEVVREMVDLYCHGRHKAEWEMETLWERLRYIFPFPPADEVELEQLGNSPEEMTETIIQEAERLYAEREAEYTPEVVRQVEVQLMLGLIDERWADYLTTLEHLKEDIRWQSLGQRDPLVEFKAEAFAAFKTFQDALKQEIVRYLFHSQIQVQPAASQPLEGVASHPEAAPALVAAAQSGGIVPAGPPAAAPVMNNGQAQARAGAPAPGQTHSPARELRASEVPAVGRNAMCPCGSGRKYKRCHGLQS